jgi:hypothetical protein
MDLRRDQTLLVWHGSSAAGDLFTDAAPERLRERNRPHPPHLGGTLPLGSEHGRAHTPNSPGSRHLGSANPEGRGAGDAERRTNGLVEGER